VRTSSGTARSVRRAATLLLVLGSADWVQAQSSGSHHHGARPASPSREGRTAAERDAADPAHAVHDAMSGSLNADPHLRLSPPRTASGADSARAASIVREARVALERFKDVRVAEREGYRIFAPNIPQPVYHFTSMGAAIREHFRFDPSTPTSLLYKQKADGSFRLVGAMYTAPKEATPNQLNERVPLGIARWHLHTNMCVPRMTALERWGDWDDGRPVFGPLSPIATREACDAVDGRFLPVVFNWMVHVNVYEDNPWEHDH